MPPFAYKYILGDIHMDYICKYSSPIGGITIASDGNAITGLWFDGQKYFGATLSQQQEEKDLLVFAQTRRWLDLYFDGKIPDFTPPLFMMASPFRRMVWEVLRTIPYGCTMTYGQIAESIAERWGRSKMSAQAVGGAVGHNPISLIVPCHRVVGTGGSLTGYAGGIDKKVYLLTLEKADMSELFVPKKGTAL